jgi:hypothetical protein
MIVKTISNAGSNEAGAWVYFTDGSSIKYVAALNITIVDDGYDPIPETYTGRKFV